MFVFMKMHNIIFLVVMFMLSATVLVIGFLREPYKPTPFMEWYHDHVQECKECQKKIMSCEEALSRLHPLKPSPTFQYIFIQSNKFHEIELDDHPYGITGVRIATDGSWVHVRHKEFNYTRGIIWYMSDEDPPKLWGSYP